MGRHTKQTVDYFPHYAHHGKTLHIIENLWGNDGYAFFYKLLEILADEDGHYYDCRDETGKEFLAAKTSVPWITGAEILNKLSIMGIIDAELWEVGVVWMETFTESVKDAYRKRSIPVPVKPQVSVFLPPEIHNTPQQQDESDAGNPQSKLDKSKVKKNFSSDSIEYGLANLLLTLIKDRKPDIKDPNIQHWALDVGLMIRRDNRKSEDIEKVIRWCQQDSFWQNNILSTGKLREQFDQLWLKLNGKSKTAGKILGGLAY